MQAGHLQVLPGLVPTPSCPPVVGAKATLGADGALPSCPPLRSSQGLISASLLCLRKLRFQRVQGLAPGAPREPAWVSSTLPVTCSAGDAPGLRDNAALWDPLPLRTRALSPETLPHLGQIPRGGAHPGTNRQGSCHDGNGGCKPPPAAAGPQIGWALESEAVCVVRRQGNEGPGTCSASHSKSGEPRPLTWSWVFLRCRW